MATRTRKKVATQKEAPVWRRAARPDKIDFRDRRFLPNVALQPKAAIYPEAHLAVKHQGDSNACTGFALSLVVEHLLRRARRGKPVSPWMLYSMARRYDEFAGWKADDGSSLRGALKGWFKHGACAQALFPAIEMPPAPDDPADDWWFDAVRRPLGAYYRIDCEQITDMHAALNEVGALYVSAGCHAGWDRGIQQPTLAAPPKRIEDVWQIPVQPGLAAHAGHAFAIVGYDRRGFLVQNSWGTDWGSHGYAILGYDDWLCNAMDCWVAQLGVVTNEHEELARRATLKMAGGKVALAASPVLRNREISPYIVNVGNNGQLSVSGDFRTTPDDVQALAGLHLERARKEWKLKPDERLDICFYAHGGLVGERDAAEVAARWIPRLYEQHIFPVFLMWETGFTDTLRHMIADAIGDRSGQRAGGGLERWWNTRLERALARPGTLFWNEMKENAERVSRFDPGAGADAQPGAIQLYRHFKHHAQNKNVRMHFIGHSAGSIVGAWLVQRMIADGLKLDSLQFLAPAVRRDLFESTVVPLLKDGSIGRYQHFALTDRAEEDDPSCGPYRRSLLCLVSEAFEGAAGTPILGLERHAKTLLAGLPKTTVHWAPGPVSAASTHGGFDEDEGTLAAALQFMKR